MTKLIKNQNWRYVLLLIAMIAGWLALLFRESSGPAAVIFQLIPGLDKVAHVTAFTILGLMLSALSFRLSNKPRLSFISMPVLLVCLTGAIEEIYQAGIPGRSSDLADFLADLLGAVIAVVLANRLRFINQSHKN